MVHFDFTVSDEEAQTIFEALQEFVSEATEKIGMLELNEDKQPNVLQWWKNHKEYVLNLMKKMENGRVE